MNQCTHVWEEPTTEAREPFQKEFLTNSVTTHTHLYLDRTYLYFIFAMRKFS